MNPQLKYIRKTLKKEPLNIFSIPHQVSNYLSIIKLWNKYKINHRRINGRTQFFQDYTVRCILNFHLEDPDHIIMYYSKNQQEILLLCKQNNIYFNCKLPYMTFNSEKLKKMEKINFVAIYK